MKKKKLNYIKKYILSNKRIYIILYVTIYIYIVTCKNYNYIIFIDQSKWDKNIIANFNQILDIIDILKGYK